MAVKSKKVYRYPERKAKDAVMQNARDGRRRSWRRGLLDNLKVGKGCMDCGYNKHPAALHFDHRPGEIKLFNIGCQINGSWERLKTEILKCDVVCATCHAVRTASRRGNLWLT